MKHEALPDPHQDSYWKTVFGFWVYLLTDFMMFGALFATFLVLRHSTFGGPSGKELFSLPFTFVETLLLLVAAFTAGLGNVFAHRYRKGWTLFFFLVTFLLGLGFLGMQGWELKQLVAQGHGWNKSAFLSIFFTLIGTHTLHVVFGLLWIPIVLISMAQVGLRDVTLRRIACLKMFWQFLNFVWIFIFALVYLMR